MGDWKQKLFSGGCSHLAVLRAFFWLCLMDSWQCSEIIYGAGNPIKVCCLQGKCFGLLHYLEPGHPSWSTHLSTYSRQAQYPILSPILGSFLPDKEDKWRTALVPPASSRTERRRVTSGKVIEVWRYRNRDLDTRRSVVAPCWNDCSELECSLDWVSISGTRWFPKHC